MCGIRTDKGIVCWGDYSGGKLDSPEGEYTDVSAGWEHTCGIRTDRTVVCWGWASSYDQTDSPDGEFIRISAGLLHTCGIRGDQTVSCWGINTDGQADAPEGVFTGVSAGLFHTCGIRTDKSIRVGVPTDLRRGIHRKGSSSRFPPVSTRPVGSVSTGPPCAGSCCRRSIPKRGLL